MHHVKALGQKVKMEPKDLSSTSKAMPTTLHYKNNNFEMPLKRKVINILG
jgi:hypothetical protein